MKTKSFHDLKAGDVVYYYGAILDVLAVKTGRTDAGERTLVQLNERLREGKSPRTYKGPWWSGLNKLWDEQWQVVEEVKK